MSLPSGWDHERLVAAAERGVVLSEFAALTPGRRAIEAPAGDRTFAELDRNANRLLRALRQGGLRPGSGFAVLLSNRAELVEAWAAALRGGLRMTPINWHLLGPEVAYIVEDCDARALIAEPRFAAAATEASRAPGLELCLSVGGPLPGFESYEGALAAQSDAAIEDPVYGQTMLYTSGTTGKPKGVHRHDREPLLPQFEGTLSDFRPLEDRALCTGPAYHAAPLMGIARALVSGTPVVFMERWDAEDTLRLIERHGITHTHMVPTMFHRLLALPEATRRRYDLSSLRVLMHGAAPCPVHVKRAIIEWLGPVLYEYYAATEGTGGFLVSSQEWLERPGTVGRPGPEFDCRIDDDSGNRLAAREIGTIYIRAPARGRFEYYKDPEKTARAYRGDYFTLGDMGYFDEQGYLFLTGRSAEVIVAGGVNIYPQEIDAVLLEHPAVRDACTVGAPDHEWGEVVTAVIELQQRAVPSEDLAAELIAFTRQRLASFKCPRKVEFAEQLPRSAAGKIERRRVRERFWRGHARLI